jgi:molecular chaperone HscB
MKIQPPAQEDYFLVFGLDRKLAISADDLEARFHDLSWKLHPDSYQKASAREKALSLNQSSILNDAYRTLRDPVARTEYLLRMEGARREGAKRQQAPQDLLEEVFALNESLDEMRMEKQAGHAVPTELASRLEEAKKTFEAKLNNVDEELLATFEKWDALPPDATPEAKKPLLDRLNAILNRRSYIRNLLEDVQEVMEA